MDRYIYFKIVGTVIKKNNVVNSWGTLVLKMVESRPSSLSFLQRQSQLYYIASMCQKSVAS